MKRYLFILCGLIILDPAMANNIQVSNVSVQSSTNTIQFTVTWDNGWRSSTLNNWDAAWVFVKYYEPVIAGWSPVFFNYTSGNVIPAGFTATVPTDQAGVFLYRSAAGSGTTTITNVQMGIDQLAASGIYDIKVFAIEMVYIPQGPFYAGDGFASQGYRSLASMNSPGYINSSSTGLADPLCSSCSGNGGYLSNIPLDFPNGYNAFYCMKYELSQGGYRDFLNTLTYAQQVNHTSNSPGLVNTCALPCTNDRIVIKTAVAGSSGGPPAVYGCDANANNIYDEAADGEWVPCSSLSWLDHSAYLTWAGLRPITELEYEKVCRGILTPVQGEFAWGTNSIASSIYALTNPDQASEVVTAGATPPAGNAVSGITSPTSRMGPVRNGIFATATSNRISSGGSFYGVMEMSGNLYERVVTTAAFEGQFFRGHPGTGTLSSGGYSMELWPGNNGATGAIDGSQSATGLILRGGSWLSNNLELLVSHRSSSLLITDATNRDSKYGCRGGRTAP